jgi:hypothetical protein
MTDRKNVARGRVAGWGDLGEAGWPAQTIATF